jgi:hypothetical protein
MTLSTATPRAPSRSSMRILVVKHLVDDWDSSLDTGIPDVWALSEEAAALKQGVTLNASDQAIVDWFFWWMEEKNEEHLVQFEERQAQRRGADGGPVFNLGTAIAVIAGDEVRTIIETIINENAAPKLGTRARRR